MKIGIFGGTFNPPHMGHLLLANEVYHQMKLDEIWFMPNSIPPHKQQDKSVSNEDRKEMVQLLIKEIPYFKLETIEIDQEKVSYTVDTMRNLTSKYPSFQFYFIIGGDMVEYLPKFKEIDALASMVEFIGVTRNGYSLTSPYPIHVVSMPIIDLSSTMIRNRIKTNQPITFMVTKELENFIQKRHLYES